MRETDHEDGAVEDEAHDAEEEGDPHALQEVMRAREEPACYDVCDVLRI